MKKLASERVKSVRREAFAFMHNPTDDKKRASNTAANSSAEHTSRKRITTIFRSRKERTNMATKTTNRPPTRAELQETIDEQEGTIEQLEDQLSELQTAVGQAAELLPAEDDEADEDEDEDDEED
jgi:septal ring factor EnvC (AmiA/AmiB activator)